MSSGVKVVMWFLILRVPAPQKKKESCSLALYNEVLKATEECLQI